MSSLKEHLYLLYKQRNNMNHLPNATPENIQLNILHEVGNYWVSNEGTKKQPAYHVWQIGITHSTCDSAYTDISLAVARCKYLSQSIASI